MKPKHEKKRVSFFWKLLKSLKKAFKVFTKYITYSLFKFYNVKIEPSFQSNGIPYLSIQGEMTVGKNLSINNNISSNPIGRNPKSIFVVRKNATLIIGENVGMSGTTIFCSKHIYIGNNVKLGGNVCIYDTDFHSLEAFERMDKKQDIKKTSKKSVIIEDNVFIGAHSTILKGVKVGSNSIIGACSLVSNNIPPNEIWGGCPARFIKKVGI